jgi:hypothetical protein
MSNQIGGGAHHRTMARSCRAAGPEEVAKRWEKRQSEVVRGGTRGGVGGSLAERMAPGPSGRRKGVGEGDRRMGPTSGGTGAITQEDRPEEHQH